MATPLFSSVLFLLLTIASLGWPVPMLIVLPAFFGLYFFRFSVGGIPFTLIEWLIFASFFAYVLRITYKFCRRSSYRLRIIAEWKAFRFRSIAGSFWGPAVLMLIALGLSFTVVPVDGRQAALGIIKSWFIAPMIFAFLLFHTLPGLRSARRCVEWYVISAVLFGAWGIAQWIFHFAITPDGRVSGPFASANYLAFCLVPAAVYVLMRLWHILFVPQQHKGAFSFLLVFFEVHNRPSLARLFWYGAAAVILIFSLYLTRSYGGYLGFAGAIFGYSVYHWFFSPWRDATRRALLKLGAIGVGLLVLIGIFVATSDPGKFVQVFHPERQSSGAVRLQVWNVAREAIARSPFLGLGPGQFESFYAREAKSILGKTPYEINMLHPHNIFLMFWISSGILGLLSFLWILIVFFRRVLMSSGSEGKKRFTLACGAMLLSIVLHGLVDTPIWKNDLALQFWLIIGVFASLRRFSE